MSSDSIPQKQCMDCALVYPETTHNFRRSKGFKSGYHPRCKVCWKLKDDKYRAEYFTPERVAYKQQRDNQYYANHKEQWQVRQNTPEYRAKQNERHKQKDTQSPGWRKKYRKREYQRDKLKIAQRLEQWKINNIHRIRAIKRRYKAKRAGWIGASTDHYTDEDVQRQYTDQNGQCYYCERLLNGVFHPDHFIPLSRGGSNAADNIVIACPHCNLSKGNRLYPDEWQPR